MQWWLMLFFICGIQAETGAEEVLDMPLPPRGSDLIFPASEGFLYEVQAVEQCLAAGQKECPEYPLQETLNIMKTMDEVRRQLGVKYPSEAP